MAVSILFTYVGFGKKRPGKLFTRTTYNDSGTTYKTKVESKVESKVENKNESENENESGGSDLRGGRFAPPSPVPPLAFLLSSSF